MSIKVTDSVSWVGKIDWELRKFHGEELSTHNGSSYNAYLIRDEKTVLIDTVWVPFAKEFVAKLAREIDLKKIDYIIVNHGEPDHSGALPGLLKEIPGTPVYCTANAVKSLKGQYHEEWNFQVVKTGDNILFSNDAFGQHYASGHMYNDLADQNELWMEALKYYANILTPFSKLVERKIKDVLDLGLPVFMICPSHGVMWRKDPMQIVEQYGKWAQDYQENQITILYDTMWNGTRKMAEAIAEGIKAAGKDVTLKLYNTARSDKNDIITEVFKSKAILVGSPTVNKGILSSMAGILEEIKGLSFKNKKAAAFGTYGWSGESVKLLNACLSEAGFTVMNDGLKVPWSPDEEKVSGCRTFGRDFVSSLK